MTRRVARLSPGQVALPGFVSFGPGGQTGFEIEGGLKKGNVRKEGGNRNDQDWRFRVYTDDVEARQPEPAPQAKGPELAQEKEKRPKTQGASAYVKFEGELKAALECLETAIVARAKEICRNVEVGTAAGAMLFGTKKKGYPFRFPNGKVMAKLRDEIEDWKSKTTQDDARITCGYALFDVSVLAYLLEAHALLKDGSISLFLEHSRRKPGVENMGSYWPQHAKKARESRKYQEAVKLAKAAAETGGIEAHPKIRELVDCALKRRKEGRMIIYPVLSNSNISGQRERQQELALELRNCLHIVMNEMWGKEAPGIAIVSSLSDAVGGTVRAQIIISTGAIFEQSEIPLAIRWEMFYSPPTGDMLTLRGRGQIEDQSRPYIAVIYHEYEKKN
ncbi:Uncharacterised protein [Candidatus Burarchaeum australiense]|nr:Uncharacterised protein [Candidatus Burarchaeum australiense]